MKLLNKLLFSVEKISIDHLVHDNKEMYVIEGQGDKSVHEWPIYTFFYIYFNENKQKARELYFRWYIEQYEKYKDVDSRLGGMKGGSLDRLVQDGKQKGISLEHLVYERVDQRLLLAHNIQENKYVPNHKDPVRVLKLKNNSYRLFGGHHRVAILAALGNKYVNGVYVYNNNRMYSLHKLVKRIGLINTIDA